MNDPTATFDINEWTTYASDYCLNLGTLAVNNINDKTNNFNIYPNPVTDVLNINGDVSKVKSVKIYDISGKLVKDISNPFMNQKSIDVRSLLPDTYILNIDGKSIKFIKK